MKREDGELSWKFNLPSIKELVVNGLIREIDLPSDRPAYLGETIFIYGGKSDFVMDGDQPGITSLFPNNKMHCLPDAGHYLHVEKPKEFLSLLISVLK